jgi:DNA-binding CsgD family transcriptional regulator
VHEILQAPLGLDDLERARSGRPIPPEVACHLAQHVAEPELTSREIEVLGHIVRGNRNRDIGDLLHISEETVKTHMSRIMQKLGARDRAQAIPIAVRRGFLKLYATAGSGQLHIWAAAALATTKGVTDPCQCWGSVANPSDIAGISRRRSVATLPNNKYLRHPR